MTEQDKIWITICQWVGNMEFLAMLTNVDFTLPVPLERENQQVLLEYMQNYNNNQAAELQRLRTELRGR